MTNTTKAQKKINKGLFTSFRNNWKTPKAVYQVLNSEFHFDHDPCPSNPKIDGLISPWGKSNFVNPPYGNQISKWIKRGYEVSREGNIVVFLIPSRTDTKWWHNYVMKADEIRFIEGRLRFDDQKNSAPFPSCIVIYKNTDHD